MSTPKKNILVIRLSAMGDVAMTIPVLQALTKQYSDLKITVLTKPFFKPLFRNTHNISVIAVDVQHTHKGVFGLYKLARVLNKSYRFYAIADLHNVIRSKLLKLFITSKVVATINKGRKEKQQLTSGKLFKPLKSTHQRYADVFGALGYPVDLSNPSFPQPVTLKDDLKGLVGDRLSGFIGIAPFAAHEGKVYPLTLMEEVVKALSTSYKIILFGGGKDEADLLVRWETSYSNTVALAGKLSLERELDIISNLDIMLSMDSGNAHLAAMMGVKVVTIWGVTHPYAGFMPFNQPEDYALLSDKKAFPLIPTSVYGNIVPKGYEKAAASVLPDTVVDKIKAVVT